jgi:HEPN domain-containing protein
MINKRYQLFIEKWEAYHVHARQCFEDSKNGTVSAQNRAYLSLQAGEFILKAVYYKKVPDGEIRGHLSQRLVDKIQDQIQENIPIAIKHAAKQVEEHYQASRYPEDTSKYFCCLSMEVACQHYPDVLDDILRDIEIIFQWGEEQIQ